MNAVDFALIPLQEDMVGNVRGALVMILAAVGFLLVVACANVELLLAQVTARQREFAVRSALGATRLHLARQFITENLLVFRCRCVRCRAFVLGSRLINRLESAEPAARE